MPMALPRDADRFDPPRPMITGSSLGGVCSVIDYGQEGWELNQTVIKMLKGWNARCLSVITSNEVVSECRRPSHDLIAALRVRRLRWVGHILRREESRLDRRVLVTKTKPYKEGDVLMDCPHHESMEELIDMANDRIQWNINVNALKHQLAHK